MIRVFLRGAHSLFVLPALLAACGADHAPLAGGSTHGAGGGATDGGWIYWDGSDDGSDGNAAGYANVGHIVHATGGRGGQAGSDEGGTSLGGSGNSSSGGGPGIVDAGAPSLCGDGVRQPDEFCDGTDLHDANCEAFGYTGGTLRCTATCAFEYSQCTGTELCFDGLDNDGNRKRDCSDPVCNAACADACEQTPLLLDPGRANADSSGHASQLVSSCLPPSAASGPELVFRFVARTTGAVRAVLSAAAADFSLSVRTACTYAGSEMACRDANAGAGATETIRVPVTAGDELFFVVDGADVGQAGIFNLEAESHAIVCGDAERDPGEECDDGNTKSSDGCSGSCVLESDETEDNGTIATANTYTGAPFIGEISSVTDVDVYSVKVTQPNSQIAVDTYDLGDGACLALELDDRVEILSSDGKVLATNDDGGDGFCASLILTGLSPATYYVRVSASGTATSFPYSLDVTKSP